MPQPAFSPGFRFSAFDALVLAVGGCGSLLVWPRIWWLGFVTAFAVGHFFLFCNVFRISRRLELIWAATFITLSLLTVFSGHLTWTAASLLSLAATTFVVGVELRKPSYHGVGWNHFNPNLRLWWETTIAQKGQQIGTFRQ